MVCPRVESSQLDAWPDEPDLAPKVVAGTDDRSGRSVASGSSADLSGGLSFNDLLSLLCIGVCSNAEILTASIALRRTFTQSTARERYLTEESVLRHLILTSTDCPHPAGTRIQTNRPAARLVWLLALMGFVHIATNLPVLAGDPMPQNRVPGPGQRDLIPPIFPQLIVRQAPWSAPAEPLWPLVQKRMQLNHQLDHKRVRQEIAWLRNHPDFLQRLAPRFESYAPFIFREIERRDLPAEILFVPVIESALDPFAFSPGGAAGLWQFMPATGNRFKLKRDWWVDERRDPMLATVAALDYLELLYRRFDDWYLAIAAYNAGEGRISRAVRRAGHKNFFKLRVPKETAGYIPRLLAFAAVFNEPEKYDFNLPFVSTSVGLKAVETGSQLDLTRAAQALGVTVEKLYEWNPSLNQWATHPRGPHRLLVSQPGRDAQALIDAIPVEERLSWQRHQIRSGDTLGQLAERHNIDTGTLMRANQLKNDIIHIGDSLLIPTGTRGDNQERLLPSRRSDVGKKSYRVVRGDSLSEIAQRFNVSLRKLQRLNQIGPGATLRVGQRLVIPQSRDSLVKAINYKVREGDSLSRIAARFNVTTKEIRGWNELDLAKYLQPGQRLRLYVDLTAAN